MSQNLHSQYKRIFEITLQLGSTYDHMSLLRKIVFAAQELIDTEAASILLMDDSIGKLRFAMSTNIKPHEMEEITVPLEGSIAGWIMKHGEPRVIEDSSSEGNHFRGVGEKIDFQTRNLLGVPMRAHKDVIGVVQAVNKQNGGKFTDDDVQLLRILASQAAMAIENARMFQQSDFISEMVHELRTPLLALQASTTLLQRKELPDDKRSHIVTTMKGETQRLITLTNDFLDVARLESGRVSLDVVPYDIQALLVETADMVSAQAAHKNITIQVTDESMLVEADRGKVKQVLLNLLTNAIKYNRSDGSILLSLQTRYESEQAMAEIRVADTGYGISKEHQKNMFQKFYRVPTLENVERGTGLGLAICKNIIEAHGGRIWLESQIDVGSTFFFTLPLSQPSNGGNAPIG
ncbi:MAG: GAF domain-containing sensor histidine kinase [Anaerolineae bacterium]